MTPTLESLDTKIDGLCIQVDDIKKDIASFGPRIVRLETQVELHNQNTGYLITLVSDKVGRVENAVKQHEIEVDNFKQDCPKQFRAMLHNSIIVVLGVISALMVILGFVIKIKLL